MSASLPRQSAPSSTERHYGALAAQAHDRRDYHAEAHWLAQAEADRAYYDAHERIVSEMKADGRL